MNRRLCKLCCQALLLIGMLMPASAISVSAASEGDVYAALRSIGVPEDYIGQCAGALARGTSDGAGVYRSDGSYYSYSDMVGYIYANQDMILAYCGVMQEADETSEPAETEMTQTGKTETAETDIETNPISSAETTAETTTEAGSETSSETSTGTTAASTVTSAIITTMTSAAVTAAELPETNGSRAEWIIGAGLILVSLCGISGMVLLMRRQNPES